MARIDEIADGVYRIATPPSAETPITFNQFLIDDERPALIHTGVHGTYDDVRAAVSEVLDPARLAYVVLLHYEGDECGGMDRFMTGAPEAQFVGSALSLDLNLRGFGWQERVLGMRDGDRLELGRHRLRFLETPHVHHWDSMMVFDEATRSLFPSDLFIQPGDQPPVVDEDLSAEMCAFYREVGIFAHEEPVRQVVQRVEALGPDWVHAMHGGTLTGRMLPRFAQRLREEPFAYQGKLMGRALPGDQPATVA